MYKRQRSLPLTEKAKLTAEGYKGTEGTVPEEPLHRLTWELAVFVMAFPRDMGPVILTDEI